MAIIPESGKPTDVVIDDLNSPEECSLIIGWIDSIVRDIEDQLGDQEKNPDHSRDTAWAFKARTARRLAEAVKYQVMDKQLAMRKGSISPAEAFRVVVEDLFDKDEVSEIYEEVNRRWPGLMNNKETKDN